MKEMSYLLCFLLLVACKTPESITQEDVINDVSSMNNDEVDNVTEIPMTVEPASQPYITSPLRLDEPASTLDEVVLVASPKHAKSTTAAIRSIDALSVSDMSYRPASPSAGTVMGSSGVQRMNAGQLTAGEWNDLHQWDKWKELVSNGDYVEMQSYWKIFAPSRHSVFVRNKYELPIQDAKVELINKSGEVIWTARTDNAGRAELWSETKHPDKSITSYDLKITTPEMTEHVKNARSMDEGSIDVVLPIACHKAETVEIMFVVDATGSMGDEIEYLQSELEDVITRSKHILTDKPFRLGSIFYRDHGDAYVTRVQDLDQDISKTIRFIREQSADGGGDYPEAIEEGLAEALAQEWSPSAQARIIFLLLDAPPHENPETVDRINNQIKEAAALGIKIIPITASGINRQTEYLMKFAAIATNGTYVFITDHSGIGGGHLEHIEPDYEVEKLNDILVRLITNYSKSNGCQNDQEATLSTSTWSMFPNPASQFITVRSDEEIKQLRIVSNSGKMVHQEENLNSGEHRVMLGNLVDGIYTLSIITAAGEVAKPLIVVHNS